MTPLRSPMFLLVVLEVVVLLAPGQPDVEAGGYVICFLLLLLAGLAPAKRWALTALVVLQGLLALGGIVAAVGPTSSPGLVVFALVALGAAGLAGRRLRRPQDLAPAR